jgi:ribose transport system permease protein
MTEMTRSSSLPALKKLRFPVIGQIGVPLVIVLIVLAAKFYEPRFWSLANAQNLLRQMTTLQILTVGQLFAVISGGLDLSVAAVMAFASVCGVLAMPYLGLGGGLVVMVLVGLVTGTFSGLFVTSFKVSPLIVTLGVLSICRGLALVLAGGVPVYDVPNELIEFVGFGALFGIPVSSLIAIGMMIIGAIILGRTVYGRHIYAIGSNRLASENSGLPVSRRIVMVYAFSGVMAGVAAIVTTAWVSAAQPTAGQGLELQSLAAVVVGGVSLTGGRGTMWQAFLGVLLLSLLSNALDMIGVSSYLQVVVIGLVILLSVIVDRMRVRSTRPNEQ